MNWLIQHFRQEKKNTNDQGKPVTMSGKLVRKDTFMFRGRDHEVYHTAPQAVTYPVVHFWPPAGEMITSSRGVKYVTDNKGTQRRV